MKLLLDENLSAKLARFLQEQEQQYDAISVLDLGLMGKPDEDVRAAAIATGRVLVTLDADFADIFRFPPAGTPGIIRLKIHPPTEEAIREQLVKTLRVLKNISLAGCLAISHGDFIRIRA